jgi:hypothetical protein
VHGANPDMLAYNFLPLRQTRFAYLSQMSEEQQSFPDWNRPGHPMLRRQARKLQDLDEALDTKEDIRAEAVSGTKNLLQSANYSIAAWCNWISNHDYRPMKIE